MDATTDGEAHPRPRIEQVLDFGVEEEFVLADARDRSSAARAEQVVDSASGRLGPRVKREFYTSMVELNSLPCRTAEALRADLVASRRVVAAAAADAGCLLLASGTSVLNGRRLTVSDDPRYVEMVRRYSFVPDIVSESNACHVHVGTLDREEALQLGNHMRPWLPVLQAVASNSPFLAGKDPGCASSRHFLQRMWPTCGPAPVLDGPGYERLASQLVASGEILDRKMIYWYTRPSEHLPTLECRVTDVNADVDLSLLVAVLIRGLATTLLAELRHGRPAPRIGDERLLEGHRQAAVHGLAGSFVDPVTGRPLSLGEGLRSLVRRSHPGLDAAGDSHLVQDLLALLRARGTGADQQRADRRRRGSLHDVVDRLAARTLAG